MGWPGFGAAGPITALSKTLFKMASFGSSTISVALALRNFAFQLVKRDLFFKCNWQLVHPWNANVKIKVKPKESHPNIKMQQKLNWKLRCSSPNHFDRFKESEIPTQPFSQVWVVGGIKDKTDYPPHWHTFWAADVNWKATFKHSHKLPAKRQLFLSLRVRSTARENVCSNRIFVTNMCNFLIYHLIFL